MWRKAPVIDHLARNRARFRNWLGEMSIRVSLTARCDTAQDSVESSRRNMGTSSFGREAMSRSREDQLMRFCRRDLPSLRRLHPVLILWVGLTGLPLQPVTGQDTSGEEPARLTAAQLDELVGPIALYPDKLIAVVLPASTYPLEVVQADRLLNKTRRCPTTQSSSSISTRPFSP